MSAISFCDWETTTAMSVSSHERDLLVDAGPLQLRAAAPPRSSQLGEVRLPLLGDEVVHPHRGRLVDRDEHRLAEEPAADEVADEVGGDPLAAAPGG